MRSRGTRKARGARFFFDSLEGRRLLTTTPVVVDLLAVYTPTVASLHGGDAGMQALIQASVDTMNKALIDSAISLTVRLVHSESISYSGSGDTSLDRQRLETNGDGYMDGIFNLRNQYGADLVTLISDGAGGGGNADLMTSIGDPTFGYHTALTRIWGLTTLRLANADLLPFDYAANAAALEVFVDELEHNAGFDQSRLPLADLRKRVAEFRVAAESLRAVSQNVADAQAGSAQRLQALNASLLQVESNWLDPAGIPGRPWFRHLLYSARYTYAHLELPGLTEAVEGADWERARDQAQRLESALVKNTQLLRAARAAWLGQPSN